MIKKIIQLYLNLKILISPILRVLKSIIKKIIKLDLHWQILIALTLGVLYGLFLPDYVQYIGWMGTLFMNSLKMIIIPLILGSIISGITNLGSEKNLGRLSMKTFAYYIATSTMAILVGLLLVNIIKPGTGFEDLSFIQNMEKEINEVKSESIGATLLNIIPTNIFDAFSTGKMLSVIFFAILFGFFINKSEKKSKEFMTSFFNSIFDIMMKITLFIIKFTPFGVFGLIAAQISENTANLIELAQIIGLYMLTVFLALAIHAVVVLPLLLRFIGKSSAIKHFKAVSTPLLTAFSTASSGATLPLTMEAVERKSGVSNKITSFTLPLGATINMDGTALYECIAAMFIAQVSGFDFTFSEQALLVLTALLASIGAAAIPHAGLVMLTVILTTLHLDVELIGLIIGVDRVLDMFRTSVNVWSDTCGAVIIAKSENERPKVLRDKYEK